MKYVMVTMAFLVLGATANAQESQHERIVQKLVELSEVEDDSLRLAQFDLLVEEARFFMEASTNANDAEEESDEEEIDLTDIGDWQTQVENNPLDDTETFAAFVEAETSSSSAPVPPSLVLRCQSQEITAYIKWEQSLGESSEVTYRVGENDSINDNWIMSTDSKATFYPDETIPFLNNLKDTERFVAQVTPTNANAITAIFDITGVENIVARIISCAEGN